MTCLPYSFRQWEKRRSNRALCRTMLRQLALVEMVNHIDRCRTCREEIAKRQGLGWRMACALIRSEGEKAIRSLPITDCRLQSIDRRREKDYDVVAR